MQWGPKLEQGLPRHGPVIVPSAQQSPEQAGAAGTGPVDEVMAPAAGDSPVHGRVTAAVVTLGTETHADEDCTTVSRTVAVVLSVLTVPATVTATVTATVAVTLIEYEGSGWLLLLWQGEAGWRSVSSARWTLHEHPPVTLHSSSGSYLSGN